MLGEMQCNVYLQKIQYADKTSTWCWPIKRFISIKYN